MSMRKLFAAIFAAVLLVLSAACTPQSGELPGTGQETPPGETPVITPTLIPQAVLDAQAWLSEQLGVPVEELEIVNLERASWQDSCLGLGGPAESCALVITPGWRVTFATGGQEYEIRTDETGSTVRMAVAVGEESLTGTQWSLESFGPVGSETPVIAGSTVTLEFEEGGQAGGSGGCNTYGTPYEIQDTTLSFSQVVSTEMACLEEGVMDQEQHYYEAIQSAGEFELAGDRLTISYDDGKGALNFVRAEAETPGETPETADPLTGTQWRLESFGAAGSETPVVEGSTVTLEFGEDGRAGGTGGCNSYGAEYHVEGSTLSVGQITSTLMACADERLMDQEGQFFQAIEAAGEFELADGRLTISYDDKRGVLNFVK